MITTYLGAVIQVIPARSRTLDHNNRIRSPVLCPTVEFLFKLLLGNNLFRFPEHIFIGTMLMTTGCNNNDSVIIGLFLFLISLTRFNY